METMSRILNKDRADSIYPCKDGSVLYTYTGVAIDAYTSLCNRFFDNGYEIYAQTNKNGNHFTTLTKGPAMAHLSFYSPKNELTVAASDTAADTLPPKAPDVTDGAYTCTVAQIEQTRLNGMSYVVQLKDGSYILYDGGYTEQADRIAAYLKENYKGEGKPVIRAWLLTHSHNDHYPAFITFSDTYANDFIVEHIIVSPLDEIKFGLDAPNDKDPYLGTAFYGDAAKLTGAKIVFAHTGMEFSFCNVKMEILMTPENIYKSTTETGNFNNSSIVSRVYDTGYSALFLGDIGIEGATLMAELYGDYLKSDICQVAHHGVETVPFSFYDIVKAPILYYPCNIWLYRLPRRNNDVRAALEKTAYTKEILLGTNGQFVRAFGTAFDENAPLFIPMPDDLLVTDKTAYTVGEPILCTAKRTGNKDWVGIAKLGETCSRRWWYLRPKDGEHYVDAGVPFNMLDTTRAYCNETDTETLEAGTYLIVLGSNGSAYNNEFSRIATVEITIK
ncbi:MAG: MBL fold metallo-hydrolase [Clostridia bacterium]|nr:MBL fold metallo-hydrolase [Clostridia bacterium]